MRGDQMSCKCSGTEQINWLRQLLLLVRVRIVIRCLCIASISNKMPVWNNCQEAVGLGVKSVAYPYLMGKKILRACFNFQFQGSELLKEKMHFLLRVTIYPWIFTQPTVERTLVSSSKPMNKLTQLCWQICRVTLLLITAGKQSCALIQQW